MANTPDPKIHPLFARERFPAHIRYKDGFYDAAVLATGLMETPQALQHDYCFYFGVNTPVDLPRSQRRALKPAKRPMEYACDKGVGELDDRDIQAVREERLRLAPRVSYIAAHTGGSYAWTEMQREVNGISGRDSIITPDHTLYRATRDKNRRPKHYAKTVLMLASTLVHEAAHAAHHHFIGNKCEDFREVALITEAGFELESRIFGARAHTPRVTSLRTVTGIAGNPSSTWR